MRWRVLGRTGNICCLGARGLTLKMRKDATSRKMFSPKRGCHCLFGLGVLTSLPWTVVRCRLHTNDGNSEQKCYWLRFPRLPAKRSSHPEGRKQERKKKEKPDNFIRLAWRRCIITCYSTCTCGCAGSGGSTAWMYNKNIGRVPIFQVAT